MEAQESVGIVFDIKQFALYDGPGIRDTVFLKGCPLRCEWCHNPEGLTIRPQLMVSRGACRNCGKCKAACPLKENESCTACGRCIPYCPDGLRRIAGEPFTPEALAQRLLRDMDILTQSGGGVTFSGGEPLMQWAFVEQTIDRLAGIHTAIETSGYASDEIFSRMMARVDLVMMDIKLMDNALHLRFTGVGNEPILRHARMLKSGQVPFIIRIPVIPGVNDTLANFEATAELLEGPSPLQRVELLPYHKTAGAKYAMVGRRYDISFDPEQPVQIHTQPFEKRGIAVRVM